MARKRKNTRTSAFGSPGRISHDASGFYNSRLYKNIRRPAATGAEETPVPEDHLDRIHPRSSERMAELPDNSVHLMVTSPPYNASKTYDQDLSLGEYLDLLRRVWRETYRVLAPGGRACINIANLGRKPYIPLHAYIILDMQATGFLMRGEIIWDKGSSAGSSTAWGSWCSASNPVLRDVHEYILVFSKETFSRKKGSNIDTIGRDAFLEYTRSVWTFPAASARRIGHPAPFPIELPLRLIHLYSFENDIILDPFAGSGSTWIAALKAGRRFVGYEIDEAYIALAEKRVQAYHRDCGTG